MMPKPLAEVHETIEFLTANGCEFIVTDRNLTIADPNKVINQDPEIMDFLRKNKLNILAYIQQQMLRKILRVVEMAQPTVELGMKEDFFNTLAEAGRMVGDPWED